MLHFPQGLGGASPARQAQREGLEGRPRVLTCNSQGVLLGGCVAEGVVLEVSGWSSVSCTEILIYLGRVFDKGIFYVPGSVAGVLG